MRLDEPWVTSANTHSRNSVKAVTDKRNTPYDTSKATGTASTACMGVRVMASMSCLSSNGTPTLASLAAIMNAKARPTRQR